MVKGSFQVALKSPAARIDQGEPKMKLVSSVFVMAALAAPAAGAWADELQPQGFTNADLNSGYACNLSGTLGASQVVGVAQFRPQGDGTFGAAALRLHVGRVGVCQYSLIPGTGTYNISPNGMGLAQATYTRQPKSSSECPATFPIHLAFATSDTTCDIATLDPGVFLGGNCKKQTNQ
jgi:hypothetical protein